MERFILDVQERTVIGKKVGNLRQEGLLPAVLYGGGEPTLPVQLQQRDLDQLIAQGGALQLINLVGDDLPDTQVLMREVQRHPVRRTILHVDFIRVAKDIKLQTQVPVVSVGTAPVEEEGGIVLQNLNTIEIECLPEDIPAQIEVDISVLTGFSDTIMATDLVLPEGVALAPGISDEAIFSITVPRAVVEGEEEEELEGEVPEGEEPEVIGRESDEEEDWE
jgi:large subunit ribosomal protein L25